jgi:transcriptional regulator with XRE-family HTH domain
MADLHNRIIEDGLCEVLARMRHETGIQLKDLAYSVGVSRVAIWKWENGVNFPRSLANLRKWTEAVAIGAKLEIKIIRGDDEFIF